MPAENFTVLCDTTHVPGRMCQAQNIMGRAPGPKKRAPAGHDDIEAMYEFEQAVGAGVYGTVYKAKDRASERVVAIKMMKNEDPEDSIGVSSNLLREVACLRDFYHPNIVEFIDIFTSGGGAQNYLVFEYVEAGDLGNLLKAYRNSKTVMPMRLAKQYSYELLNGVHACHQRLIIHRDLKPQNMLISKNGLKIADFGLARTYSVPPRNYTREVITLWYRSPEILLGSTCYGTAADMWSVGCIMAEMATGFPIFPGDSEIGTIFKIFRTVGTPTLDTWPGLGKLSFWRRTFPQWEPSDLRSIYDARPEIGSDGTDVLRSLLTLNPEARSNARRAKTSPYFDGVEK